MRRADRLFQIVQILRRRSITTAAYLAERLEVSERTIYRDIRDLVLSGVPVESEAGLGYALRGFDLPPLMFTVEEIEALVLGTRVVQSWADPKLARSAAEALFKIDAVLPERLKLRLAHAALYSPNQRLPPGVMEHMVDLRRAIRDQRKVHLGYTRADGQRSKRIIRPLCLAFFPPIWLVSGWCELRGAFRNFRLDRISNLDVLEQTFEEEPGRNLEDFLALVTSRLENQRQACS